MDQYVSALLNKQVASQGTTGKLLKIKPIK